MLNKLGCVFILALVHLLGTGVSSSYALELERDFHVELLRSDKGKIPTLKFKSSRLLLKTSESGRVAFVRIRGTYQSKDESKVLFRKKPVKMKPDGSFSVLTAIKGRGKSIKFVEVNARGTLNVEKMALLFNDWPLYLVELKKPRLDKRWKFDAGMGFSYIRYTDSRPGLPQFNEFAITVKGSVNKKLNKRWSLAGNLFITGLPLSSSLDNVTARFLGVNARAGWDTLLLKKKWKMTLYGGWYFATMFPNKTVVDFGYQNLNGPQLFPVFSHRLSRKRQLNFYLKFSPVASSFSLLSLGSHEKAIGANYVIPVGKAKKRLSFTLDFAHLLLNSAIRIEVTSLSLGAAYHF